MQSKIKMLLLASLLLAMSLAAGAAEAFFAPTAQAAQAAQAATPFVTTDGHGFAANGQPLPLRGFTFYPATDGGTAAWRSTSFTTFIDSELTLAQSAGQNLARPTDYWDSTNTAQTMTDPVIWSNMDYLVNSAAQRHMYVLMDLSAYKWLLISQGKDPYNADNWTPFLQFAGARYKNATNIVAYSIVGEPPVPTSQLQADQMVNFYAQVTTTLYQVDPNHLISAGGFNHMESGSTYHWWQRIYALPHNDVCGFKTYSQHDLDYMPTITTYTQSINKPALDEEFGAPQSLGDATWSGVTWNGISTSRSVYYTNVYSESRRLGVNAFIFWNLDTLVGATHYDVSPQTPATWAVVQSFGLSTASTLPPAPSPSPSPTSTPPPPTHHHHHHPHHRPHHRHHHRPSSERLSPEPLRSTRLY